VGYPPPGSGFEEAPISTRSSGILLHPTSLPGPGGIGELGKAAHRFVEVLAGMRQSWWQMLPVGPTGFADSPYQSPSTFAGNPLLVDLGVLVEDGLLEASEPAPLAGLPADRVDYGEVIPIRMRLLDLAADRFLDRPDRTRRRELGRFRETHGPVWLDDYALFAALKQEHELREWTTWEPELVRREPQALAAARKRLRTEIRRHEVIQFLFRRQWTELRRVCSGHGIRLIGDLPIFVAHDSAEVWANPHLFFLGADGLPTVVAGVPPDYFSETGQRWGNPLYRWTRHRADGFAWWMDRLRHAFSMFDLVRVDHFRGFAGYWEIPASEPTAVKGRWVRAPGRELFDACLAEFGELPVIAEDLGVITEDVEELRDRYGFPGMKVLQFGFGFDSEHHPDAIRERVIVYTGTHDNDTTLGWFTDPAYAEEQETALEFLDADGSEFNWDLMRVAMASVAETAVVPLQDLLGLGSDARMNTPGVTSGNWSWRFGWEELTPAITERFRLLTEDTGRGR
jgi:4-alpha-glucanotransferase